MQVVRLHDPSRRPANWTGIIRPGQFAVFAVDAVSGAARDLDAAPFANGAASCAIVDSLDEARAVADAAVARYPGLRLDIFESDGRTRPPLLTILHPDRAASLDHSPRQMRKRRGLAWTLVGLGVPLVVYAATLDRDHDAILPAFVGINMILVAARLFWINLAMRETEQARAVRVAAASAGSAGSAPEPADPRPASRHPAPR